MSTLRCALLSFVCFALAIAGCGDKTKDKKDGPAPEKDKTKSTQAAPTGKAEVAFIVNGAARFWDIAEAGMLAAEKEFGIKCEYFVPTGAQEGQKRILEDLLARGIKGVAISPIDPDNQQQILDQVANAGVHLVTHDSDAPNSKRKFYVGVDNYAAGREAGKLVKEAMPEGGTVMIFVGRMEQLNARQRRQGVIDELMDRPVQKLDELKFDGVTGEIKNDKYNILDTRTDEFDSAKKVQQPEDALTKYPDLGCMVGLFEYNPPAILQAVRKAGRLGKTKIVGFDEADDTLVGISEGHIQGTIAQQPFGYGYESVKILAGLIRKDDKLVPKDNVIFLPPYVIKKDGPDKPEKLNGGPNLTMNAKAFRDDVNAKLKTRDAK